jgi:hypothetical protein
MSSPVAQPPTKTISGSRGRSLLPAEKWKWYLTEITKRKRGFAVDMLASHGKEERKKP